MKTIIAYLVLLNSLLIADPGWIIQNTEIPNSLDVTLIQFLDANTGYIAGGMNFIQLGQGYVYKTINGGVNWSLTNAHAATTQFFWSGKFLNANTGWAVGVNGTAIKTTNGGTQWVQQNVLTNDVLHYISFINDQTGWIVGWNGVIRKTTNQGATWFAQTAPTGLNLFHVFFNDVNTGWVGGDGGLFITNNGGQSWTRQSYIPSFYFIFFINNTTGWAASRYGMIVKTTNQGGVWINQNSNSGSTFYTLKFFNTNTGWAIGDYSAIRKTTNGGDFWYIQQTQIPNNTEWLRCGSFININTGWAVGYNGMLLKTTNGGEPIGIENISSEIPVNYSLSQNYPNPFNPVTFFFVDIPISSNVKIGIFNELGKEIEIINNSVLAAGKYKVTWNASERPSGIYFYTLQSEGFFQTKKMIIVK